MAQPSAVVAQISYDNWTAIDVASVSETTDTYVQCVTEQVIDWSARKCIRKKLNVGDKKSE